MIVEEYGYQTQRIILHEIGHHYGLFDYQYFGIDSFIVPYDEYPSVMNYNSSLSSIQFNNSDSSFNDIAYIESNFEKHQSSTSDLSP